MTLFGRREGAFWVLAALVVAALAFLTPRGHEYEPGSALRFLITFALVAFFSFGLESSRHRFHSQLLAEKSALEDALAQVKTLRGLLPICARCKKIRDDQGYWQQIELFVDRHTDAEFSHSLCPSCVDKLYPDLLDETD